MIQPFLPVLDHLDLLLSGLATTLAISLAAILMAVALGGLLAWASSGPAVARVSARIFIELMRALPFLVVLLLIHFGAQRLVRGTPAILTGCVALALYASAYFAEVMRAALASVPKGQWEAAAALGLHPAVAFYKVILAQMAVVFVPAGQVVAIMLLKESAVLSIITVPELTHSALRIQAETFQTVPIFVFVTLCYWAAITLLSNAALAFAPHFLSAARHKAPLRRFRRAGPSGSLL